MNSRETIITLYKPDDYTRLFKHGKRFNWFGLNCRRDNQGWFYIFLTPHGQIPAFADQIFVEYKVQLGFSQGEYEHNKTSFNNFRSYRPQAFEMVGN